MKYYIKDLNYKTYLNFRMFLKNNNITNTMSAGYFNHKHLTNKILTAKKAMYYVKLQCSNNFYRKKILRTYE